MEDSELEEMDVELYERMSAFYEEGLSFLERGDAKAAIREFHCAFELLPGEKENWAAAGSILSLVAEAYFGLGEYAESAKAFFRATRCFGVKDDPIFHLRLGQCFVELGEEEEAMRYFKTLRKMDGENLLLSEEDEKYLEFIEARS